MISVTDVTDVLKTLLQPAAVVLEEEQKVKKCWFSIYTNTYPTSMWQSIESFETLHTSETQICKISFARKQPKILNKIGF